jgi:hypothetical protein
MLHLVSKVAKLDLMLQSIMGEMIKLSAGQEAMKKKHQPTSNVK